MPLQVPITYLKDTKLNEPEVLTFFREWSIDALRFNMREDALWFAKILESLLNAQRETLLSETGLLKEYQAIIARAQWAALSLLTENEILDLFERALRVVLFDPDFDAWTKVKEKFISMLIYEERDALKKKIIDAMLRNQESITTKPFQSEGRTLAPTAENWLRDYIRFMGIGPLDKLKQAQYFSESKNLGALAEEERAGVMRLVHFYERCRLSSLTVQGREEDMPVPPEESGGLPGVIREGRFEPDDPTLVQEIQSQLEAIFPERALKRAITELKEKKAALEASLGGQNIVEEVAKLELLSPNELVTQCAEFLTSSSSAKLDVPKTYAYLQMLAKSGLLLTMLSETNPVREAFVKYLREEGKTEDVQQFQLAPGAPASLAKFLKFVLVRRMRMSEGDAAQIAVRVGNIMKQAGKPEYFDMAYFDQASGRFRWKS